MDDPATPEEVRARVAARIRALAQRRHLQLIALADQAGVSRSTLWAVLAGRTPATTDTLTKLAAVLRVDPIELLRGPPRAKQSKARDR